MARLKKLTFLYLMKYVLQLYKMSKKHWDNIYATKGMKEVSWFQEVPQTSLDLIASLRLKKDAAIIDVGGGNGLSGMQFSALFQRMQHTNPSHKKMQSLHMLERGKHIAAQGLPLFFKWLALGLNRASIWLPRACGNAAPCCLGPKRCHAPPTLTVCHGCPNKCLHCFAYAD